MLAFDTGPGVAVIEARPAWWTATLLRSRRPMAEQGTVQRARRWPSCWRIRSSPPRRPRAPAGSASATSMPARCTSRSRPGRRRHRRRAHRAHRCRRGGPLDSTGRGGRRLRRRLPSPRPHGRAVPPPEAPAGGAIRSDALTICSFPAMPRKRSPLPCSAT